MIAITMAPYVLLPISLIGDLWCHFLSPIRWIIPIAYMKREARIIPVLWAGNQAVLDWIEMDVIHMIVKIKIISYEMFPISTLPDGCLFSFMMGFVVNNNYSE